MRTSSFLHVLSCVLLMPCLHGADSRTSNAARDEAAGVPSSLAQPASGEPVLSPELEEYAFLEESLLYQASRQKNSKLRLFATGAVRYDSNLFLAQTGEQDDTMWSFSPGFQYSLGESESQFQVLLDYNLQVNRFERFQSQNSLNHFLNTSLVYRLKKTTISFLGRVTQVTGGDVDVGGQAQRLQYSPKLEVTYDATDKIRLGLSTAMERTDYDALLSSTTYRVGVFADYAFSPQLRLGLQVNQMLQDVEGSGRHTGQDVLARVEWEAFQKLFVNGSFGVQFFHSAQGQDSILPLGSLGLRYEIGPKTSMTFNAYSRSQNSPSLGGQYFQSNGFVTTLQQQLGTKLNVGADFGYEHADYRSYSAGVLSDRQDSLMFVRPWVKYTLHRHLSLELFYQHTTNSSSGTAARSFDRDLLGLGLTTSW
ncbi:MAG: outer membrane beta-barrel protein [Verrucomicrobiaceae bacterium]|nr:outer membrane beta-barrel protein [Verrucomicrobiaceae bacterium]